MPAAVNCHRGDRVYYRRLCSSCIRRGRRLPQQKPRWESAGYRKMTQCDRCGFRARYSTQLTVFHVNGDLRDCDVRNLRTVCLNCVVEVSKSDLPWRRGDLEEDR
jgi:hypothetical protein